MRPLLTQRTTTVAGWATLLVMLTVGALGLKLVRIQYANLSGVLLDGERRSAEALRASLERHLDDEETRILASIASAGPDLKALSSLKAKEPLIDEPFVLAADGTLITPGVGGRAEAWPGPEEAPSELFDRAMMSLWGKAPPLEKIKLLDEAARSPQSSPIWRLRAWAQCLALQARTGMPDTAARGYEALFREHFKLLSDGAVPTILQLTSARAECLEKLGDQDGALGVIAEALERLERKELRPTFAEEALFLRLAAERYSRLGRGAPPSLAAVELAQREKQLTLAVFETLRGWALARHRVEAPSPDDGKPRHVFEERGSSENRRSVFVVWTRPATSASAIGTAAVGFRVASRGLDETLRRGLEASKQGARLVVSTTPQKPGEELVDLASFRAERSFVRIGIEKPEWDQIVGKARQPFVFAGFLTAVLLVLVAMGLLVFLRGVRREMTLSRMKTELVANVSHELKTPLALIRLFGETLLLGRGDPESREKYCRIITRESERLTNLISSVLSFASIEAGKKRYDLKLCDIASIVRETFESYQHHLEAQGFSHQLEIETPEPATAEADSHAVAEALINLLDNAVKYSKGTKNVRVRLQSSGDEVRVSVRDQGVGISSVDQKRVFEDYYRTKEARALGTRGSGLGLSLVQHILKAHKGRVELESRIGEGSVFTLVFPRRSANDAEDRIMDRKPEKSGRPTTGRMA